MYHHRISFSSARGNKITISLDICVLAGTPVSFYASVPETEIRCGSPFTMSVHLRDEANNIISVDNTKFNFSDVVPTMEVNLY